MSSALAIEGSNLPAPVKNSLLRQYYGRAVSVGRRARLSARHGISAVKQGGEALVVGLALGAAHAEFGLDIKGKAPVDLGVAALGMLYGVFYPTESLAEDARNMGAAGVACFGFRQGYAYRAEKKLQSGGSATPFHSLASQFHGDIFGSDEYGEEGDPIVNFVKGLK